MIVMYDKDTGVIRQVLEGLYEYPGPLPEGRAILVFQEELGGRIIRTHKVDLKTGQLVNADED